MGDEAAAARIGIEKFGARKAGGTRHREQALCSGSAPVVDLPAEFVRLVEFHVTASGIGRIVDDIRLNESHSAGDRADVFKSQQRMAQVIEHAEEQHVIEMAESFGR